VLPAVFEKPPNLLLSVEPYARAIAKTTAVESSWKR